MYKLILKRTDSNDPDFLSLVDLLNEDMKIRDGDDYEFFFQFNSLETIRHVIVAYENNIVAGCGSIRPYTNDTIEIKRMYVPYAHRRKGIAIQLLIELEKWAVELGFTTAILETGIKQPEAISLYQKTGYSIIPNYGQYEGVDVSVCMSKRLSHQ